MLDDLKKYFESKAIEIREAPDYNSYKEGSILLRQNEIEVFERNCRDVDSNPIHKNEIFKNFKGGYEKIKKAITHNG